jgi:hypothetical protein
VDSLPAPCICKWRSLRVTIESRGVWVDGLCSVREGMTREYQKALVGCSKKSGPGKNSFEADTFGPGLKS